MTLTAARGQEAASLLAQSRLFRNPQGRSLRPETIQTGQHFILGDGLQ